MVERLYTTFKDNSLFEEAIRLTMTINNTYHVPQDLRDHMSELIGKKVPDSFRLFPPFYTGFW